MLWKLIGWMNCEIKRNRDLNKKKLNENLDCKQYMKLTGNKLFKRSIKGKMTKI